LAGGAALFVVGWALVLVSGYGGDSTGGSELVWRVGGVMVYVAVPLVLASALIAVVVNVWRRR
jgi:hypothetical protein